MSEATTNEAAVSHKAETSVTKSEPHETAGFEVEGAVTAPAAYQHAMSGRPDPLSPRHVLALQGAAGNRAVSRLLAERKRAPGSGSGQTGDAGQATKAPEPIAGYGEQVQPYSPYPSASPAGLSGPGQPTGNGAVTRGRSHRSVSSTVQRLGGGGTEREKIDKALNATPVDSGLVKDIDDFSAAKPDERIKLAEILVNNYTAFFGPRDRSCLTRIFQSFGDDLKYVANQKPFLLEKCLKEWPGLMMDLKPVENAAKSFKTAIGTEAKKNLDANIKYLKSERKRMFGEEGPASPATLQSSQEQNVRAKAMIRVVENLLLLRRDQKKMLATNVGFKYVHNLGSGVEPQSFKPGQPPTNRNATGLQYDELNEAWNSSVRETGLTASKYPWLFGILKDPDNAEMRLQKLVDTKENPYAARVQIMGEMQDQIDKAQRIMDGYNAKEPDWYDLVPVRERLFETGLDKNFERLVARQVVTGRDDSEYWKKVGIDVVTGVAILVATFATAGAAPVMAGVIAGVVAVGVPAAQAYAAYEKAEELGASNKATVLPESDIVSQMQVDAARAEAIAKTIEAILNLVMVGVEGGLAARLELRLGRLAELSAAEQKTVIAQAIKNPKYGAVGTSARTGMSLSELLAKVGAESDAGVAIRKEAAELAGRPVGELTIEQRNALRALAKEGDAAIPAAERVGLADPKVAAALGGEAQELIRTWSALGSEDARLQWARGKIQQHLKNAGIDAEIPVVMESLPVGSWGKFRPGDGTIVLNRNYLKNDIPVEQINEIMKTVYHEARHAEQYWLMARRLYGKGWNAPRIDEAMGLRADLIASARRAGPIADNDAKAAMIDIWLKDFETPRGRDFRKWFLEGKREWKGKFLAAEKEFLENSTGNTIAPAAKRRELLAKMQQAKAEYDKFYQLYKTSGVEADAYGVEAGLKLDLTKEGQAKAIHDEMFKLRMQVLDEWDRKFANRETELLLAKKANKPDYIIRMRERDVAEAKEVLDKIRGVPTLAP